jgi:hypothetical protein
MPTLETAREAIANEFTNSLGWAGGLGTSGMADGIHGPEPGGSELTCIFLPAYKPKTATSSQNAAGWVGIPLVASVALMGVKKGPSEGGSGGGRGHSGTERWGYHDEVKEAARTRRRLDDTQALNEELDHDPETDKARNRDDS